MYHEDDSIYNNLNRGKLLFPQEDYENVNSIVYITSQDSPALISYINKHRFRVLSHTAAVYCLKNFIDLKPLSLYLKDVCFIDYIFYFSMSIQTEKRKALSTFFEQLGAHILLDFHSTTATHYIIDNYIQKEYHVKLILSENCHEKDLGFKSGVGLWNNALLHYKVFTSQIVKTLI